MQSACPETCQYATSQRITLEGMSPPVHAGGLLQLDGAAFPLRCSLYGASGTDLCEHREHVEVVRGALDLTALDLDDFACRHLEPVSFDDLVS